LLANSNSLRDTGEIESLFLGSMAAAAVVLPAQVRYTTSFAQHTSTNRSTLQHVPSGLGRPTKQRQPFDATILCAKLAALQLPPNTNQSRSVKKRDASKRLSYVPQHAAKHFASTTTPMASEKAADVQRAKSAVQQRKPSFTADGKPFPNPKILRASLAIGMSESEATTNAWDGLGRLLRTEAPRKSTEGQRPGPSASAERLDDALKCTTSGGYLPGDAARRNAIKRRSQHIMQPQGTLIKPKHGSQTTHERVLAAPHPEGPAAIDEEDDEALPLRPKILSSDRPNWTQESQCGEDMDRLLHKTFGYSKSKIGEAQPAATTTSRPNAARMRSTGSAPENLISNAVSRIKKEEKGRRRRTFIGFFKRS
jgi:hypothetical protein